MSNKVLLVDDEKVFLNSLKEGLDGSTDLFKTDICFSVDEAVGMIETNPYDLVITDIRMPDKSGIDLLIHLQKEKFKGDIKVMSAHKIEENQKLNKMGVLDVIEKPFNLDWFHNMLVDYFERVKGANLVFDSIELISVLQVINIDKKSAVLQIENNGSRGVIYFKDGDIINGEYNGSTGEEAVTRLLELTPSNISVKNLQEKIKPEISLPFTELIMNTLKKIDEKKKKQKNENKEESISDLFLPEDDLAGPEDSILEDPRINKEEKMSTMGDMLTILNNEVNGLKAASIFGKDGMPVVIENPARIDIDAFSAKFAMVNALISKSIKDLEAGTLCEILVEEEKGYFILRPLGKSGLMLFIAVSADATLGNLRLVAKKVAAEAEKLA